MNNSLTKTRDLACVFFETLFILFILSTSITSSDGDQIRRYHEELTFKAASTSRTDWRSTQTVSPRAIPCLGNWSALGETTIDLPASALLAYKSFFTNALVRSVYHIFGTASAP